MFTGIIQAIGTVAAIDRRDDGYALTVDLPFERVRVGDSIAVAGVCLTVTRLDGARFEADVSAATLVASTLAGLAVGARVNLEPAVAAGAPLGGHLVSGHVDGTGEVLELAPRGESRLLRVRVPAPLARYFARKGSVSVDGVSLTVNAIDGAEFEANLVAHTLAHTTLGGLAAGDRVNLEVDMVARYLERLLEHD